MIRRTPVAILLLVPAFVPLGCKSSPSTPAATKPVAALAIEDLIAKIDEVKPEDTTFELWVPERLTIRGQPALQKVGDSMIKNHASAKGFVLEGCEEKPGGRLYKFKMVDQ